MQKKEFGIRSAELTWQPEHREQPILDHVSISLACGGFYGIIGPNGSGKTSFLDRKSVV